MGGLRSTVLRSTTLMCSGVLLASCGGGAAPEHAVPRVERVAAQTLSREQLRVERRMARSAIALATAGGANSTVLIPLRPGPVSLLVARAGSVGHWRVEARRVGSSENRQTLPGRVAAPALAALSELGLDTGRFAVDIEGDGRDVPGGAMAMAMVANAVGESAIPDLGVLTEVSADGVLLPISDFPSRVEAAVGAGATTLIISPAQHVEATLSASLKTRGVSVLERTTVAELTRLIQPDWPRHYRLRESTSPAPAIPAAATQNGRLKEIYGELINAEVGGSMPALIIQASTRASVALDRARAQPTPLARRVEEIHATTLADTAVHTRRALLSWRRKDPGGIEREVNGRLADVTAGLTGFSATLPATARAPSSLGEQLRLVAIGSHLARAQAWLEAANEWKTHAIAAASDQELTDSLRSRLRAGDVFAARVWPFFVAAARVASFTERAELAGGMRQIIATPTDRDAGRALSNLLAAAAAPLAASGPLERDALAVARRSPAAFARWAAAAGEFPGKRFLAVGAHISGARAETMLAVARGLNAGPIDPVTLEPRFRQARSAILMAAIFESRARRWAAAAKLATGRAVVPVAAHLVAAATAAAPLRRIDEAFTASLLAVMSIELSLH